MALNSLTVPKVFCGVVNFLNEECGKTKSVYTLKSFSINCPCSAQDNFMSEIYSVDLIVNFENDSCTEEAIKLIAKSQIASPESAKDVNRYFHHLIFTKEMLVYKSILERMETLSLQTGLAYPSLAPKLCHYYTEGDSYSCLLMDNLVKEGFYIPKTHGDGIQLDECYSIMRAMARFHALSLVIEGEAGKSLPEKDEITTAEVIFTESGPSSSVISVLAQSSYAGMIQLAEKFRPELVSGMKELDKQESIWKRLCSAVKPGVTSFSCLCHGDARLNNIFINKEDIKNVRFIDFQLTRYASPITDLQYLLHVSATKEFREKYTDQLLQVYFEEFMSIFGKFPNVKLIPSQEESVRGWTLEKLKDEYYGMTMFGFLISTMLLPVILLRPGDIDKSVGQMSDEERGKFWSDGRQAMVFELGSKHPDVRKRMLDICEEGVEFFGKK